MGLLEQLHEDVRAQDAAAVLAKASIGRLAADNAYWQMGYYAFVLHDPTQSEPLVFPLVLNPQTIRKVHPFAAEVTPTQEGGVLAEENGVLISDLTITGHTGVRPRVNPNAPTLSMPLSGQAHFLWLQDACFLRYAKLKRDPLTAGDTWLEWRNYKDGEHWVCVPRNFSLERSRDRNFLYNYSVQVALIEEIQNSKAAGAEDANLSSKMKDAVRNITAGIAQVESKIKDIQNIASQVSSVTVGVLAAITGAIGVVNQFVTGAASAIRYPLQAMRSLADDIDLVMSIADPNKVLSLPYDYVAAWLEIQDGILRIASYPAKFSEDWDARQRRFLMLTLGPAYAKSVDLDAAAAASTITQASQLETSALRPGDAQAVQAGLYELPLSLPRYRGFREVVVQHGDTITSLAARELGDARKWLDIALANDLQSPYLSEEGLPFTLQPGDPVLIPTTNVTQPSDAVRTAGHPEDHASQLDAMFGRDFALKPMQNGYYDLVIDPSTYTDVLAVSGLDNLEQVITTILSIEKGAYLLHQNVGVARIIGRPGTVERVIEARSRVIEAVQRDTRVAKVRNASFSLEKDALAIALDVEAVDTSPIRVIGRVIS